MFSKCYFHYIVLKTISKFLQIQLNKIIINKNDIIKFPLLKVQRENYLDIC